MSTLAVRTFQLVLRAASLMASVLVAGCQLDRLDATYVVEVADAGVPIAGLRVSGSQIVDAAGHAVRLTGVTWHGLETAAFAPAGLWTRSLASLMGQIRALGYNSVRFTISFRLLDPDALSQGVSTRYNPGLSGLPGLEMLDRVIEEADTNKLKVIVCQDGWAPDLEEPLWYNDTYSEDDWVARWQSLALRYRDRPNVIGFELHDSPHNTTDTPPIIPNWGDGGRADWWAAATRAGNAVLAINPRLLVFVDGVHQRGADPYWWGGNLTGVEQKPVELDVPNRVVYATHDYPKTIFPQPWFSGDANYFEALPPVWSKYWGYLVERDIAPVWIAEFGTADELGWLDQLLDYATSHQMHFAYRAFNPNTFPPLRGVLNDDWETVNQDKQGRLSVALAPLLP
jgi:endoglucanase